MKILICDDDIYFAQCIYKFLQQIESEQNLLLEIQSFNNTEALLDVVKTDSEIKLIFLDIIFTGSKVNGIKIAKEIEKINYKVKIVFITSYDSFAIQGYQMNTVGYLMKPIEYNVFKEKFKTYLAQLDYEEKYLCIKTECNYVMIKYNELMYIDTLGRTVGVHTINQVYRVRHTMRELETMLQTEARFVRSHAAYIVNIQYIASMNSSEILLRNGETVLLSKYKKIFYGKSFGIFKEFPLVLIKKNNHNVCEVKEEKFICTEGSISLFIGSKRKIASTCSKLSNVR
ncbi:LytR/AlgR family response regulator transcription factor [Faecalimonas umbilicata]|uniref:LytR/AlgR family response regulator transcription factor n=1 Tax=Faecalimonas umbilicata TaxID=1912855 RepID=UPI003992A57B